MKRLTRSSRRSTEDAMVTSFGPGERSTRSRTSSDDLIISELPKPTRSRKHSSADKRSELSKDSVGRRKHVSAGSKHRTRSKSGSDHRSTEPSPRVSKGSKSNTSPTTAKDGPQGKNEKVQSEAILPSGEIQTPKRSTKSTTERNTRPKETSVKSAENTAESSNDDAVLKVSSYTLSPAKRTRNNSGNNVTMVKHSKKEDKQESAISAAETHEKVPLNSVLPIETKVTDDGPSSTAVMSNSGDGVHLHVKDTKTVSNDSNSDSKTQRTDRVGSGYISPVASSNEPRGQSRSGNAATKEKVVSPTKRLSPRKGPPGEEPLRASPPLAKSSNPLVTSMQADSKEEEDIVKTSKRKLPDVGEPETGNGSPGDAAPMEQRRKRHRSSSRNLTTEFDNSLKSPSGTTVMESSAANSGKHIITTDQGKEVKELSLENNSVADVPTRENKFRNKTASEGASSVNLLSNNADRCSGPATNRCETVTSQTKIDKQKPPLVTACSKGTAPPPAPSESGSNQTLSSDVTKQSDRLAVSSKETHSGAETITDRTGSGSTPPKSHKDSTSTDLSSSSVKANLDKPSSSSSQISNDIISLAGPSIENCLNKRTLKPGSETSDPEGNDPQQRSAGDVGYEASHWSQEVHEGEPFFFESDHLALKGNKDYRMLLRTLTTLEAQRKQATQDLECLVNRQKQALSDPISFVNKIQHNVDLALPNSQRVVPLPEVSWEVYLGKPENSELLLTAANQKIKTRPSNAASVNNHHNCLCCKKVAGQSCQKLDNHVATSTSAPSETNSTKVVVKPDSKSETFNQPWTLEEQRKLEELLVTYPMEAVEARRWEKIADGLGNRTPLQVASRVQKYFIKLTRAGLPVPGRLPHSAHVAGTRRTRRTYPFMRPMQSTFLQSVLPPVYMTDNDSWDSMDLDSYFDEEFSDDESIQPEMRDSEEYRELKRLKQMKRDKLRQQAQMTHSGFQCDSCGVEPLVGTRWHCSDCPSSTSTDLCQKCMDRDDYKSIVHSGSHHLEPIRFKMEAMYVDNDYTRFQQQQGPYNYLDPNYSPEDQPTL